MYYLYSKPIVHYSRLLDSEECNRGICRTYNRDTKKSAHKAKKHIANSINPRINMKNSLSRRKVLNTRIRRIIELTNGN